MLNGRITAEQMEWLEGRADELGGNLSAALRQTITDARLLEYARQEYRYYVAERGFTIPPDEDGTTSVLQLVLSGFIKSETDDLALREEEATDEAG